MACATELVTKLRARIAATSAALIAVMAVAQSSAGNLGDPALKAIRIETEGMWVNGLRFNASPGSSAVAQGSSVKLSCTWSASLVPGYNYWKADHNIVLRIAIRNNSLTMANTTVVIPAGTWLGVKVTHSGGVLGVGRSSTATNSPFGNKYRNEFGPLYWKATGGGMHTFQCAMPDAGQTTETRLNVMHTVAPAQWPH